VTLAILAVILPSALADRSNRTPDKSHRVAYRTPVGAPDGPSGGAGLPSARAAVAAARQRGNCHPTANPAGYLNPLAHAVVRSERVDQGVDYAGHGTLVAIGSGRITYVGTSGTGWPGAFVQYRLSSGADAGCYVYYAEGVTPDPGLKVGDAVRQGEILATIIPTWPTGLEVGWGAGDNTKTYALKFGRWTAKDDADSKASPAGKLFSQLIAALGGPPGRNEG
jgi:hypothetical protein